MRDLSTRNLLGTAAVGTSNPCVVAFIALHFGTIRYSGTDDHCGTDTASAPSMLDTNGTTFIGSTISCLVQGDG